MQMHMHGPPGAHPPSAASGLEGGGGVVREGKREGERRGRGRGIMCTHTCTYICCIYKDLLLSASGETAVFMLYYIPKYVILHTIYDIQHVYTGTYVYITGARHIILHTYICCIACAFYVLC